MGKLSLFLLAAAVLPNAAIASDRQTEDFVYKVRADAAWSGVEVSRISWDGERMRAFGADGAGRDVTIERVCGHDGLVCPSSGMVARDSRDTSTSRNISPTGRAGQP